ncbi:MAG: aldo/keto reductase [Gemmatimonadales bacterium]
MDTRTIGSLDVSVVGLGCNNFGGRLDQAQSTAVIHAALDAGITLFDTADIYGATKSESFMGAALKGRWNEVVLATKFGHRVDEQRDGADPAYLRRAIEDSLRRLGTDRIDLYQLHRPDAKTPIADTLSALNDLVAAGKIREIGCSNFSVAQLREAAKVTPRGHAPFVSVQNEYSLIRREPERDVLPECERTGLAFLPYFPLASGLLTGKVRRDRPPPAGSRTSETRWAAQTEANLDVVERLIAFAEGRGHTLLELAISWLLTRKPVASVIAGATKPEQVAMNVKAARWKLTAAELAEVDSIT